MPKEKDSSTDKASNKPVKKLDIDQMIAAFEARGGTEAEPEEKEEDGKTQESEAHEDTDNE